jgi:hypothetical protein
LPPQCTIAVAVSIRLGERLTMQVHEGVPPGGALSLPDVGSGYEVFAMTRSQTEAGFAWRAHAATAFGEIRVAASPQLLGPPAGTTDATLATPFSASVNPPSAMTFRWVPEATGARFAVTTRRASVTLPDPADVGFPWPAGAGYTWLAYAQDTNSVDAAAAMGYARVQAALRPGGSGWGADGELNLHAPRVVGWAP